MAKQSEAVFHLLQKDLAGRSKYGQLRVAEKSGHYIQRDQPELVTQAIEDVIRESATPITERPVNGVSTVHSGTGSNLDGYKHARGRGHVRSVMLCGANLVRGSSRSKLSMS